MQAQNVRGEVPAVLARFRQMVEWHERLKGRAKELGVDGADLARRTGIGPRSVNHYLNGRRKPDFNNLLKMCRVLKLSPDDVLTEDDSPPPDAIPSRASQQRGKEKPMVDRRYEGILERFERLEFRVRELEGEVANLLDPQERSGKARKS